MKEAAEKEWEDFKTERSAGIEEITHLRERVAEEEQRKKTERREANTEEDVRMGDEDPKETKPSIAANGETPVDAPPEMEVDEAKPSIEKDEVKKEPEGSASVPDAPAASQAGGADEDDAVEY